RIQCLIFSVEFISQQRPRLPKLADDARSSHGSPAFADVILRVDFEILIEHYHHCAESGAEFNLSIALV
ncbi:hypothetical protein AB4144_46055, partial [Rhizobiaceae sp. 2RAB30]